ncbi:MAG: chorismate pyruvate-lyase family protein [Methanomicrobiales archaeon]|nr:chorismate pyruvate-lyase family protein [Methanomicrobiales archaeon]
MAENGNILEKLQRLEARVGALSPLQKILLGTDGSVTTLLEVMTGNTIGISTERQEIIPADRDTAEALQIGIGEEINSRVVTIRDEKKGTVLIHAVSSTPLSRLEPGFRSDLLRADIPIGKILRRHRIEARREIHDIVPVHADAAMSHIFGIYPQELLLERTYSIIHQGKPLIRIAERFPRSHFVPQERVIVEAPSRIHIALIDMHGGIGRVDGGIGLAIQDPATVLEATPADGLEIAGGNPARIARVRAVAAAVMQEGGCIRGARITIHTAPPEHAGLGSGTALALAAAIAIRTLAQNPLPVRDLAPMVGRGGTSGIGTAVFEQGGFVVDGGHSFGANAQKRDFRPSSASGGILPPPVVAQHHFPEDWKIILATPRIAGGISSAEELGLFRKYCPVPRRDVQEICHEVLMRLLPGIVEHDLDLFGSSINHLQELGFKKIELDQQPPLVHALLAGMRSAGAAGAGLSSFGPTVYAITDSRAEPVASAVRELLGKQGGNMWITGGRNRGAGIRRAEGI